MQFWNMEAFVVLVSSLLVLILGNSVQKMCTSLHITMKTLSTSQVHLNVILSIFLRST